MKVPPYALALALVPVVAIGAQLPGNNPLTQLYHYAPGQRWPINTALGETILIMLERGQHIDAVRMTDQTRYQVVATDARDRLFVKQLAPAARSAMAVEANGRTYAFDLTSDPNRPAPYVVAFEPATPTIARPPGTAAKPAELRPYKLSGKKDLWPLTINDDGAKTYIRWSDDQAIPAVFASVRGGHEETINAYMRDGTFTIDRVYEQLIFRIDTLEAAATRLAAQEKPHD